MCEDWRGMVVMLIFVVAFCLVWGFWRMLGRVVPSVLFVGEENSGKSSLIQMLSEGKIQYIHDYTRARAWVRRYAVGDVVWMMALESHVGPEDEGWSSLLNHPLQGIVFCADLSDRYGISQAARMFHALVLRADGPSRILLVGTKCDRPRAVQLSLVKELFGIPQECGEVAVGYKRVKTVEFAPGHSWPGCVGFLSDFGKVARRNRRDFSLQNSVRLSRMALPTHYRELPLRALAPQDYTLIANVKKERYHFT